MKKIIIFLVLIFNMSKSQASEPYICNCTPREAIINIVDSLLITYKIQDEMIFKIEGLKIYDSTFKKEKGTNFAFSFYVETTVARNKNYTSLYYMKYKNHYIIFHEEDYYSGLDSSVFQIFPEIRSVKEDNLILKNTYINKQNAQIEDLGFAVICSYGGLQYGRLMIIDDTPQSSITDFLESEYRKGRK